MENQPDILGMARQAAAKRYLFLPHAVRQMSRPDRMITTSEVHAVIDHGRVIADYPEDPRGHSCLLLGHGLNGRAIHVVCSPKTEYLAVVTAYVPAASKWNHDYTARSET